MSARTITTCDGCGAEIVSGYRWIVSPPGEDWPRDFCELKCLSEAVTRELAKPPRRIDCRPGAINWMPGDWFK